MKNEYELSQKPAIEVLRSMGYEYISPKDCKAQRGNDREVLLKDILRAQLKKINQYSYSGVEKVFSSGNIQRAMDDLDYPLAEGLLTASEKIYHLLTLGSSYPEPVGGGQLLNFNINYIDWKHPENNVFHVTEEYPVESLDKLNDARPDVVLFINGIPFAVIECKAPEEPITQAISQMIRNQKPEYIPQLFKFSQMLFVTNKNKVKYATTYTPKKFWNLWREQDTDFLNAQLQAHIPHRLPTEQDKNLVSLFDQKRVLEFIQYFILFEGKLKKICRYQQYFGIKETIATISQRDSAGRRMGGVVWHTQGSGKSLTMVMLARYLLMELSVLQPKVVIVSDRKELDSQLSTTFAKTRLRPANATSGKHLVGLLKNNKADIVTTIINKFNAAERTDNKFESSEVFVLVDECHRTNHGQFSNKMRAVFPNAAFIGMTGTPLMKKEKSTLTKFGRMIHKYTIQEAVEDGAIVPLIYEGRMVEQTVDEENIDRWFTRRTKDLSDDEKEELKRKWSSLRRISATEQRIAEIAYDIHDHFTKNVKPLEFGGLIATNYKKDAVRYFDELSCFEDLECAVVISPPDVREGIENVDDPTDDNVLKYWTKMMNQYGNADAYEQAMRSKFEDGEIDLLIVCSKLLTGFDSPRCQVLYMDKELREHGLLQAIARTNRLREGKDYGLIVDYCGLIHKLDDAIEVYSGAGLDEYEPGDLKGVVVDVMAAVGSLYSSYSHLEQFFLSIKNKSDNEEYEVFLADEKKREEFNNLVSKFGRDLYFVLGSETAFQAVARDKLDLYRERFTCFYAMRNRVKIRYCDGLDNTEYEPLMQQLLDKYLSADGIKKLTKPVNILDYEEFQEELKQLGSQRSKADAIAHRVTKSISENYDENPAYYESFSKRIKDVLEDYKKKLVSDGEYLEKMAQIMKDYGSGKSEVIYPEVLKNNLNAQAFYGVLKAIWADFPDVDQELLPQISLEITGIIENLCKVDFSTNKTVHDRIAQEIDDLFYHYEKEQGLKFTFETVDKMIENVKTVALRRF